MSFLHHKHLSLLTEKKDSQGNPIPFSFIYVDQQGNIVSGTDAITTSVIKDQANRRLEYTEPNGQRVHKTFSDCLFMKINDTEIE